MGVVFAFWNHDVLQQTEVVKEIIYRTIGGGCKRDLNIEDKNQIILDIVPTAIVPVGTKVNYREISLD